MSYNSIIKKYLDELQKLFETAVRSGQMTDELTSYPGISLVLITK